MPDASMSNFRMIQLGMCENYTMVLTTVWSVPVITMVNRALSMLSPTASDSILAPAELQAIVHSDTIICRMVGLRDCK